MSDNYLSFTCKDIRVTENLIEDFKRFKSSRAFIENWMEDIEIL